MTDETTPTPTTPASPTASQTSSPSSKSDGHHRFVGWAACLFCSIIALAAQVTDTWDEPRDTDHWFVIVVSAISIGCSFIAIMGYAISRKHFAGGIFEGLFAVVCQLAWICGMPVIMDPNRAIAVSKGTDYTVLGSGSILVEGNSNTGADFTYIRNANIYFFSWASTIAIVYVCGRFARAAILRSEQLASWTALWYLVTLASLVVMVDGIELYKAFDCIDDGSNGKDSSLCLSTTYAVSLGTVGTFFGFIASVLATCGFLGQCLELVGSIVIFCLYMAGVTLITFNDGPGTSIGNLYFATWLGTGVAAVLLGRAYHALIHNWLEQKNKKKHKKEDDQKVVDEMKKPEEPPVVFPDVEMGDPKADKKNEDEEDDNTPSWVQEDSTASASVPPPTKKEKDNEPSWAKEDSASATSTPAKKKEEKADEEEGVEVEAEIPVKAEEKEKKEEVKPEKETTKEPKKKRNSSKKAKPPQKKQPETEEENKDKPADEEEKEKPSERDSTKTQKTGNKGEANKKQPDSSKKKEEEMKKDETDDKEDAEPTKQDE